MLEKKFTDTLSYVELSEYNYNTYSDEYAHLLQTAGAELDAFFKVFCAHFGLTKDRPCITDYACIILQKCHELKTQEVRVPEYGITFAPFQEWDKGKAAKSLCWWEAFTDVKHKRPENKDKASLKNVLYIIGALFILEMKYLLLITNNTEEPNVPDNESGIFYLKDWPRNYIGRIGSLVRNGHAYIDSGEIT